MVVARGLGRYRVTLLIALCVFWAFFIRAITESPQNQSVVARYVSVWKAWWTLHVSHSTETSFVDKFTGGQIRADPGGQKLIVGVCSSLVAILAARLGVVVQPRFGALQF